MHDLIGDIHGHAGELETLLARLGYRRSNGTWRHPERTAIFTGDFIDRGPRIAETLRLVRGMVESGAARAILGNHEMNALAFATPAEEGGAVHCRPHTEKTIRQHAETLRQLRPAELEEALEWFRGLPLWLDLGPLRVVHACWDEESIRLLRGVVEGRRLDASLVRALHREDSPACTAMETLLKGPEIPLPEGVTLRDGEGNVRRLIRTRWWESPRSWSYADLSMTGSTAAPPLEVPAERRRPWPGYPEDAPPVFVGHYWMPGERDAPWLLAPNVACLDWSVARGGQLVAYRWEGERRLDPARFVSVRAGDAPRRTMPP
ncbi:MAG: metallophosphoesterase [Phycisphaerales bacterium]